MLNFVANAYADLGEVLALAGRADEAAAAFAEALARYERKENLVMAARTRTWLAGNRTQCSQQVSLRLLAGCDTD